MDLPQHILERVERVLEYHRFSRVSATTPPNSPEPPPSVYRVFDGHEKIPLPTSLLDPHVATLSLLHLGLEALPDSHMQPPQDLKTLASWLYFACGVPPGQPLRGVTPVRTAFSGRRLYPCEIYVAAFAIAGLEPGLYHYSVKEFALRKLRPGSQTLAQITRGRPDLRFLRTVPGALLVSTIFQRSSSKHGRRAYRAAVVDAGHLIQNLVSVGSALGIRNLVRLVMNENTMRRVIGLSPDAAYGEAESVQGMVVWADASDANDTTTARQAVGASGTTQGMSSAPAAPDAPEAAWEPIPRLPLSPAPIEYGSVQAVHIDCVAPGMAVRELRPPVTETTPLGADYPVSEIPIPDEPYGGWPLRKLLLTRPAPIPVNTGNISRGTLWTISQLAFRTGTFYPMFPNGPHAALVRPLWVVSGVVGMEPGVWYFNPLRDRWFAIRYGNFRQDLGRTCQPSEPFTNAAATCFMIVLLKNLMIQAGPDIYRLAHLEAGYAAQRVLLASHAMGLSCHPTIDFYDDDARTLLGLGKTEWEPLYAAAIGTTPQATAAPATPAPQEALPWRG
jgi:SagB-type dehydrogenase family enzyme